LDESADSSGSEKIEKKKFPEVEKGVNDALEAYDEIFIKLNWSAPRVY